MNTRSISGRLLRALGLLYVLVLLLSIGFYMAVSWTGGSVEADRDQGRITKLFETSVARDEQGALFVRDTAARSEFERTNPYFQWMIVDPANAEAARGSTAELLRRHPPAQVAAIEYAEFASRPPLPDLTIPVLTTFQSAIGPMRLVTTGAHRTTEDVLRWVWSEFHTDLLPILIPLIIASMLAVPLVVRRTLRPLSELSEQAEGVAYHSRDRRLETPDIPAELQPLVDAFNATLDRLTAGFEVQRRFTADAAHELKTPLAVLRARLDAFPRGVAAELKHDADRIAAMIDQLLVLARLELQPELRGHRADLVQAARAVAAHMAPLAFSTGREIGYDGPPQEVWVQADTEGLEAALRNLVDNALRHAPPDSLVEIQVDAAGWVEVLDRGAGISEAARPHLFEPFWRGEGQLRPGAGLGLAIVRRYARHHGGDVGMRPREHGGSIFRLWFPPAPPELSPTRA